MIFLGEGGYNKFIYTREGYECACAIVLGIEKDGIILPKSFLSTLDKMNKTLAEFGSDREWTVEKYVKAQFEKAMKETML